MLEVTLVRGTASEVAEFLATRDATSCRIVNSDSPDSSDRGLSCQPRTTKTGRGQAEQVLYSTSETRADTAAPAPSEQLGLEAKTGSAGLHRRPGKGTGAASAYRGTSNRVSRASQCGAADLSDHDTQAEQAAQACPNTPTSHSGETADHDNSSGFTLASGKEGKGQIPCEVSESYRSGGGSHKTTWESRLGRDKWVPPPAREHTDRGASREAITHTVKGEITHHEKPISTCLCEDTAGTNAIAKARGFATPAGVKK